MNILEEENVADLKAFEAKAAQRILNLVEWYKIHLHEVEGKDLESHIKSIKEFVKVLKVNKQTI